MNARERMEAAFAGCSGGTLTSGVSPAAESRSPLTISPAIQRV